MADSILSMIHDISQLPNRNLLSVQQIRELEKQAISIQPGLMEQAGAASAHIISRMFGQRESILVIAGPGNNGGDAFVCARHLKGKGYAVYVLLYGQVGKLSEEAGLAYHLWNACGGEIHVEWPSFSPTLIVDGLFGIGLSRPLTADTTALIDKVNHSGSKVVSLDIPSGLDADSGMVKGVAVHADITITFIALKIGCYLNEGPGYSGKIVLAELQAPFILPIPKACLLDRENMVWPCPRNANSHKGLFGQVRVLGGAMRGAAYLVALAALRSGAGRAVIAWVDDASIDHDIFHPELIFTECLNLLSQGGVLVIGPGYGKTSSAIHLLSQVLDSDAVLLLDADALTLISADSRLQNALRRRQARTVLTPHPLEAARLLGCSTEAVLADRVTSAKKIAVNYGHPVVVKGAGSVIAVPSGQVWVSPWAIPLLSIPGSGDVLAGLIASFVAQKLDVEDALKLGVWVHGQSGGELQQNAGGAIGALASELTEAIRHILNRHERAG